MVGIQKKVMKILFIIEILLTKKEFYYFTLLPLRTGCLLRVS